MRNSICGLPVCIAQGPTTDEEKNARAEYPTVHGVETEIRSTLLFAFVAEQDGCDQEPCDREEYIDARPTHSEDVIDDRHPRWSIVDPITVRTAKHRNASNSGILFIAPDMRLRPPCDAL